MNRLDGESQKNHQPFYYCIISQEGKFNHSKWTWKVKGHEVYIYKSFDIPQIKFNQVLDLWKVQEQQKLMQECSKEPKGGG